MVVNRASMAKGADRMLNGRVSRGRPVVVDVAQTQVHDTGDSHVGRFMVSGQITK